jgi:hypothetical protein
MAFVLMIPRKVAVDAGLGRQIRRRRRDACDTWLAGSVLDRERAVSTSASSSVIANWTACYHFAHDATPRSANHKRGIPQQTIRSITADFMESVV